MAWDTVWAAERAKEFKEAASACGGAVLSASRRLSDADGSAEVARPASRKQTCAAF